MQNELIHDGTGQNERMPAALVPQFFQLDERGQAEMLQYARELSKIIQYFDLNGDKVEDWQKFLSNTEGGISDTEIQDILKYQKDPTVFAHDIYRLRWLSRPHFVLFQSFLTLLNRVKQDINRFSARHLDYYYRDILGFTPRKPEADFVYVLSELTNETANYFLPKDTLLKAGKDVEGKDRSFQTTEDILVNNAKIAEIRTVVVDRIRLSLSEYYQKTAKISKDDPFFKLIELVYGDANGNLIPLSTPTGVDMASTKDIIDYTEQFLNYITTNLFLPLSEIRKLLNLMDLVTKDGDEWGSINRWLEAAARRKSPNATVFMNPILRDFSGFFQNIYQFDPLNLQKDPSNPFQKDFQGVEDIFDLAEQLEEQLQFQTNDVDGSQFDAGKLEKFRTFITGTLFMDVEATGAIPFMQMMKRLSIIKGYWVKINKIIKKIGLVRDENFAVEFPDLPSFSATKHFPDVESRLQAALNLPATLLNFNFVSEDNSKRATLNGLLQFQLQLTFLQNWFFLPYEEIQILLNKAQQKDKDTVAAILEKAAYNKQFSDNQKANRSNDMQPVPAPPIPFNPITPYKEIFNDFFAQSDATKNTIEHGKTSAWRSFGLTENPVEVGFAIQSDLLFLSEGNRTIAIELTLTNQNGDIIFINGPDFDFWLSTKKGWLPIESVMMGTRIMLSLMPQTPAIETPPEGLFRGDPSVPVLKMTFRKPKIEGLPHPFVALKDLRLKSVKLSVSVQGLVPMAAENDNGAVNPKKPFQPFGATPTVGSRFFFGHKELFKPLNNISLAYDWKGIIGTLNKHYDNYGLGNNFFDNDDAILSSWNKNVRETGPLSIKLFNTTFGLPNPNVAIENQSDISMPDDLVDWSRYFCLELNIDLQHNNYVGLAGQKAMEFSIAAKTWNSNTDKATKYQLNPPYTPEWTTFKINYNTNSVTLFDIETGINTGAFVHLHPFGYVPVYPQIEGKDKLFLPFLPDLTDEGALFIGLSDCKPPEHIAFLFQLAEGSANPDLEKSEVTWSYLNTEGWHILEGSDILMEQTAGLSNSGIIKLALPSDAISTSTLMPQGLHWIKAAVQKNRESVCNIIQIHTQAVSAVRVLEPDSTDDPGMALPPDTITGFYKRQSGIKTISQPYISFGGKSAESEIAFLPRISERLRHRERALTAWDIERLVLAHFPDVYKAKCLPTKYNRGEVVVVLVPDIRGKVLYDAFKPKMPLNRLREIGNFLDKHGAIAAKFRATNPVYVELQVKAFVQFRTGVDAKYHKALLQDELKRFLAPWAYQEGADIAIESTIYPSVIVNFMEERPYVDYVAGVKLFKSEDGGLHFSEPIDTTVGIQASRPQSVWVSAKQHFIEIAGSQEEQIKLAFEGLGFMQLEYDFFVA